MNAFCGLHAVTLPAPRSVILAREIGLTPITTTPREALDGPVPRSVQTYSRRSLRVLHFVNRPAAPVTTQKVRDSAIYDPVPLDAVGATLRRLSEAGMVARAGITIEGEQLWQRTQAGMRRGADDIAKAGRIGARDLRIAVARINTNPTGGKRGWWPVACAAMRGEPATATSLCGFFFATHHLSAARAQLAVRLEILTERGDLIKAMDCKRGGQPAGLYWIAPRTAAGDPAPDPDEIDF